MFRQLNLFVCFLVFIVLKTVGLAQNFEWASSGSNLFSGFTHSCVTIDGRLIAGMNYEQPSSHLNSDDVLLNSGTGKAFVFNKYDSQIIISCYDQKGDIVWLVEGHKQLGEGQLLGLTSTPDGNVVVAFRSHRIRVPFKKVETNNPKETNTQNDISEFVFFSVISKSGYIKETFAVEGIPNNEWSDFQATPDLGFVINQPTSEKQKSEKGGLKTVAFNSTIKLKKDFSIDWHHKVLYSSESCCSYYVPASKIAVGEFGDIFICGNIRKGYTVEGSKERQVPILDTPSQFNPPYESYVGCLSSTGKLKWVKYSGAKSLIYDISVKNKHLVLSGRVNLAKNFFGQQIDTSMEKKAFLISLDLSGKTEWLKTFNAEEVNSICQDEDNNVFGVFRSKRSKGMAPLKIGSDTLSDSYQRIVVGSFDEGGNFRWSKLSNANISTNSETRIHSDLCGNLYYTGEMWFVLPINMALLDGAITSGKGYGGAPIAARLRTTIPDELLALNQGLVQTIKLRNEERNRNLKREPKNTISSNPSNSFESQQTSNAARDSIKSGRELSCVAMPFPWKIEAYPVPTNGPLTLRASLSYTDPYVKIDLFDVRGAYIKNLMPIQLKDAGEFEFTLDASELSSGVYLAVLKGSSFGASCKFVVTK
jgi:hypothetical protein